MRENTRESAKLFLAWHELDEMQYDLCKNLQVTNRKTCGKWNFGFIVQRWAEDTHKLDSRKEILTTYTKV